MACMRRCGIILSNEKLWLYCKPLLQLTRVSRARNDDGAYPFKEISSWLRPKTWMLYGLVNGPVTSGFKILLSNTCPSCPKFSSPCFSLFLFYGLAKTWIWFFSFLSFASFWQYQRLVQAFLKSRFIFLSRFLFLSLFTLFCICSSFLISSYCFSFPGSKP